jgi:hypothetical protein
VSGKGTLKSFKAMLAEAKLPEDVVPTCLRGDLAAEHEQLNEQLERLEEAAVDSLAGNGGAELGEQIRELEQQMRDCTYPIKLRALPRPDFRAFLAEFPPRSWMRTARPRTWTQPSASTWRPASSRWCAAASSTPSCNDAEFADLMGKLTDNQFDELAIAAAIG